ncbi:MAG: protein kinase [Planctomycetes bacterium]|nr:protein kinase [Planctomycetota bacterium]
MTIDTEKARSIFISAVENYAPDQWDQFLDDACRDNVALRQRVELLLRAHQGEDSFLDRVDVNEAAPTIEGPITERPGTVIGPYKLLQHIGEGGMGVVFMAEQTEPIQRTVALKIIKPGMDTRQVIARFEAERQALALMDHPNIAKVLDAGVVGQAFQPDMNVPPRTSQAGKPDLPTGRPYFVMELVKGVPITKYCDEKHLPLRARLELFVQVCQAVQHAHQKGIIHRDMKPNNVLVAEYDNHAIPKVIDFGVAKATAQRLTERTMFTEFGQVLGTMEYMSPEQSKFNQLDIDTRSDIYSLGVLLYELLAGSTPFEGKRLHEAAFDEMLRIIREEEPPKPSTRLSSLSLGERAGVRESLASIAANRHTEPARLSKDVQGELDWIVMKALEKDRNRRYETASGFAADIERHLRDEPVEAGPPSTMYRFRKFARRNKVALATAITVGLAVLVAVGAIGWAVRDRAAREEQFAQERTARQSRVSGQLELILDEVARLEQAEKWSDALVSTRRAEPALAAGEAPPDIQERARQALAELKLVQQLEDIRARTGTVWVTGGALRLAAQADQEYAITLRQAGIDVDVLPVSEAVHRITARRAIAAALLPALDDWLAVRSMDKNVEVRSMDKDEASIRRLIDVLHAADPDPWRQRVREAMARKDQLALANLVTSADLDRQPAATLTLLYSALWASGKLREQELILRRAQWKYPADYWINHRLGVDLIWRESRKDARDGIGFVRAAVALRPQSSHSVMNLGNGYKHLGQHDQAIACYRKAIELNPGYGGYYTNLGIVLGEKGLYEEAIAAFEEAIRLKPDSAEAYTGLSMIHSNRPDADHRNTRRARELADKVVELEPHFSNHWTALGIARYREGQWQEAGAALEKSLQLGSGEFGGAFSWPDAIDWFFLAMSNWQLGQKDQARQCYDRAVQEMEKGQTWQDDVEQLHRFRTEAEELLKITGEKPTTEPPVEVK